MPGLFSTLNIGTSGLSSQQKAIDVTSHNIANANTDGYTRQRAIIEATRPYDTPSMNNAIGAGQMGTGATVSAIQRVRDDFLDYQIRSETSIKGTYDTRDSYLSQVENIFNEPTDTGISSLMGNFFNAWQDLSNNPEGSDARTVVAQQSSTLANALNQTYNQLQSLKQDAQSNLNQQVVDVNSIFNQIDTLNQQIMRVNVSGNQPNDLMDKRDLLLDQLSQNFNINIDKKSLDGIDLSPVDASGFNAGVDVNVVQAQNNTTGIKRFSYVSDIQQVTPAVLSASAPPNDKDINGNQRYEYNVTYYKNGDMTNGANKVTITVNMSANEASQLDENRVLWADSTGEAIEPDGSTKIDGSAVGTSGSPVDFSNLMLFTPTNGQIQGAQSVQSDIDKYTNQLNSLAKSLALMVNAVHSGTTTAATDDMPFFVNSDNITYDTSSGKNILTGTNLTNALNNEASITAGNISVNKEILDNPMNIKVGTTGNSAVDGNIDGNRALAIAQLSNSIAAIQNVNSATTRSDFFNPLTTNAASFGPDANGVGTVQNNANGMTLDNYYKNTVDTLGIQEQEAQRVVQNQTSLLQSFQQSKASESGVSIDEEMTNLIQYQHAYQANAKVISTVDQLLDVVVNLIK